MKIIKAIFLFFWTIIAGMFGGQKNKSVRRFGIPLGAFFIALLQKMGWKSLVFLLLIPILCIGYGQDSFLGKYFSDFLCRIIYGILLSIPFIFFGIKRWLFAFILLPIAFSIKAGSLGTFLGMDILIEDIIRYSTLAILIIINIFIRKEK